jgi:alpha-L-fucosidase
MKQILFMILIALAQLSSGQGKYEANWESIDSRPMPQWYTDAKFGIFIHWGVYSVPAYSKVGSYAEWYWMDLVKSRKRKDGPNLTGVYHKDVFGENFNYPDFVPMFHCKMFDAGFWADIFARSGAKYVVLTSKHHDGYCLWPSDEADKSWGRPWNSANSGAMRDLLGELTTAVRKTDLKMGIYYSLYEWFNPLYTYDVDLYVEQHMIPQFKDVVERYSPSLIFSDGEWDHPDTTWHATELLSWLFNKSACRDEVVINDRWGKGFRHKHGGYYTTEYGSGLPNADNAWEENRGMAYSFGYSINENIDDYNSSRELVYMLVDIVSRGGNFLLDIGPTADGRIPVIMQERLLDVGKWLDVNGEAIYGTSCHENTCQWSKGEIAKEGRGGDQIKYDVMKLTVSPDEGMARKEILFTRKGQDLYCICPVYPKGQLVVKDVKPGPGAKVEMLGYSKPLQWKHQDGNVVIDVPALSASEVPCQYAWTFKLSRALE